MPLVWYAFNEAGYMRTGWFTSGGKWYYLDAASGAMKTGWHLEAGIWYYLNPANGEMFLGWKEINGKHYYFNIDSSRQQGAMYRNERTPDGYNVNDNGEWVSQIK